MSIARITVIGAGTMGAGIAQVAAMSGYQTYLQDVSEAQLEKARATIDRMLEKGVARGKVTSEQVAAVHKALTLGSDVAAAVSDSDLVIEAVPEKPDLKKEVFAEVERHCGDEALIASNTSSISIGQLAGFTTRPDRFVGMHFFNPVPIMKLLELVVGEATDPATVAAAQSVGERMGKSVIVVKDSPGFATSRLGLAIGLEAMRMFEEGVASAEDIDTAMTLGYGHPMGPLKLTDLVGLDVRLQIAEYLRDAFNDPRFEPPQVLRDLVSQGKLGKKSGRGFYDWTDG